MKTFFSVIALVGGLTILAGAAAAHWFGGPGGGPHGGMGPGTMGWGRGSTAGGAPCPGFAATATDPITDEKAKDLAQNYADQYLKGFNVERVLPFAGMHHTMYSVELKNSAGELRTLHINPFGYVMPFGGPWRQGS